MALSAHWIFPKEWGIWRSALGTLELYSSESWY